MLLSDVFQQVASRVDGATLVREALAREPPAGHGGPVHVLAVGKVAFPMFEGLVATLGEGAIASALLVAPETRFPASPRLPARARALVSDHPHPSPRSLAAASAALDLLRGLAPDQHLVVLLSGGGSALLAAPAGELTLEQKRATVTAVARGGATITELNTVRKHLSSVKGGRLALACAAPVSVLALSDVVGDDPATIASGPFSPDPTTFGQALEVVRRLAPDAPDAGRRHIERGAAGEIPETPKPGDAGLEHVRYRVIAGPERVPAEARTIVTAAGWRADTLSENTEAPVPELATAYVDRARREVAGGGAPRVLVGNGEPRIVVDGNGRGGRATHLTLLVARGIAGMDGVAFLAAGTDDRDGSADAVGALVDGGTWAAARARGLDPDAALAACDSATVLGRLGCLVHGPATSNLLDLHLLSITSK